jgi:DNA-binding response OmpR family regulator
MLEVGRGPLAGQSILVLEDEVVLALELYSTFVDAGASVYVATNADTALRVIEAFGTSAAV